MKKLQEGALKADKTPYSAEEIKTHNDFVDLVEGVTKEALSGMITKEEAEKQIKAAVDAASADFQTKYEKLHAAAIKQGLEITNMKNNGGAGSRIAKSIMTLIDDSMEAIEKRFKSRGSGNDLVLSTKSAVTMTTANAIDYTALDGDEIDSFRVDSFVPKRYPKEYIFDIADRTTVQEVPEYIIWDEEGDTEGAVAIVDESGLKPLLSFEVVSNSSKAKKAAGKVIVTTEFEKFKKRKYQIIKGLFNDKVMRDYQAILTAQLVAAASSYIGTTLDGTIPSPTDYDAIGAVAAQLETLDFAPDTLVINPQDKWRMALTKNADGDYIAMGIPVMGANGQVQFMNFRTITSNRMTAGTAILGEGNCWKIEEEAVAVRIGEGVTMNGGTAESDFDYNRMRIIGELFFHSYIPSNHAGSFVLFTFDTVKAALESVVMA